MQQYGEPPESVPPSQVHSIIKAVKKPASPPQESKFIVNHKYLGAPSSAIKVRTTEKDSKEGSNGRSPCKIIDDSSQVWLKTPSIENKHGRKGDQLYQTLSAKKNSNSMQNLVMGSSKDNVSPTTSYFPASKFVGKYEAAAPMSLKLRAFINTSQERKPLPLPSQMPVNSLQAYNSLPQFKRARMI